LAPANDARARYVERMTFTRITIDPAVCTGKPCIRGLRFPAARLLGLLAAGESRESYPYLEREDIDEALRYAAFLENEIEGSIISVDRDRVRRRRLPIV
jgi:uncharacterized protein (DUF433 family)